MTHIVSEIPKIILMSLIIIGLGGCCFFQSSYDRIPERKTFSGSLIKQDSMDELRNSYLSHYSLIADELMQLEMHYRGSHNKTQWLKQKIDEHKKYLADMDNYPFLCPSHDVIIVVKGEKACPTCNGKGKTFWKKVCSECSGQGKITYQSTQNKRCSNCNQLYKGSILGRTLHENK